VQWHRMSEEAARLEQYFARIGLSEPPAADAEGLAKVQQAHRRSVTFENLDIMLGRGIAVDSDAVFDKLVTQRRGGYCFEQNRLFGDMLAAMGLASRALLARVLLGAPTDEPPPRTHTLLLLEIGGESWIADAGFGGSFIPPMRLADGFEVRTADGARHRLRRIGAPGQVPGEWLLERAGRPAATDGRAAPHEDWQAQYAFDTAAAERADLEQANHWTATRPGTRFTSLHIVSGVLPDGFAALTDRQLSMSRGGASESREIADAGDYRATLRDMFALELSEAEIARLPLFA